MDISDEKYDRVNDSNIRNKYNNNYYSHDQVSATTRDSDFRSPRSTSASYDIDRSNTLHPSHVNKSYRPDFPLRSPSISNQKTQKTPSINAPNTRRRRTQERGRNQTQTGASGTATTGAEETIPPGYTKKIHGSAYIDASVEEQPYPQSAKALATAAGNKTNQDEKVEGDQVECLYAQCSCPEVEDGEFDVSRECAYCSRMIPLDVDGDLGT